MASPSSGGTGLTTVALQNPGLCPVLATEGAAPKVVLGAVVRGVILASTDEARVAASATVVGATEVVLSDRTAADVGGEVSGGGAVDVAEGGTVALEAWCTNSTLPVVESDARSTTRPAATTTIAH